MSIIKKIDISKVLGFTLFLTLTCSFLQPIQRRNYMKSINRSIKLNNSNNMNNNIDNNKQLETIAKQLNLNNTTRHIFLCADQSKAKCCSFEQVT